MSRDLPPELVEAKRVLDAVMQVQPSYEPGSFPPSEEEQVRVGREVYHRRVTVIYLALVNARAEARSERHAD